MVQATNFVSDRVANRRVDRNPGHPGYVPYSLSRRRVTRSRDLAKNSPMTGVLPLRPPSRPHGAAS